MLEALVVEYGCDFEHMRKFLPFKTKKQIQNGFKKFVQTKIPTTTRAERRALKDRFDAEVLGVDPSPSILTNKNL